MVSFGVLLGWNVWCKKEKGRFKELYQLSDPSPLTSSHHPPCSTPIIPWAHVKFILMSTGHKAMMYRGLDKDDSGDKVMSWSERVKGWIGSQGIQI